MDKLGDGLFWRCIGQEFLFSGFYLLSTPDFVGSEMWKIWRLIFMGIFIPLPVRHGWAG